MISEKKNNNKNTQIQPKAEEEEQALCSNRG